MSQTLAKNLFKIPNHFLQKQLIQHNFSKTYSAGGTNAMKVTIIGAAGTIGQSVALMLKQSPLIDELCVYDNQSLMGLSRDLNYVDTKCHVSAFNGQSKLADALKGSAIVTILTATPQSDQLQHNTMFERNAPLVKDIMDSISKYNPRAFITIATDPVNCLVPMASELMMKNGHCNTTIFGITSLNSVRANKFVAEVQGLDPEEVFVPVIGGSTEKTIIPVLSQAKPCSEFSNPEIKDLTDSIRKANCNVLKVKLCESATLSKAFAISRFVTSLVRALKGHPDIIECAFVKSLIHPQLKYMATPLKLGLGGIMKNLGIPELTEFEICLLENAVPYLLEDAKKGEMYIREKYKITLPEPSPPRIPKCAPDHCFVQSVVNK